MILDDLKSRTAEAHASLERRLLLAQEAPSLADYWNYLAAMHGFVAPLEAAFEHLPASVSGSLELPRRRKAQLILQDLERLVPRLTRGQASLGQCAALPAHDTAAQALGCFYVLEGSTLGARWLLRHLAPLAIDDSSAYLRSYGEELGAMWSRFRAVIAEYSAQHPAQDAEMVASALVTFQQLDAWFVRCGAAEVSQAA